MCVGVWVLYCVNVVNIAVPSAGSTGVGLLQGSPLPVLSHGLWSQRGEVSRGALLPIAAGAEECCPISEGVGWRGCLHPRSRRGGDGGS